MFTKQKSDENKVLLAAAKDFLGGWTRDQLYDHNALLDGVKQFAVSQREQFPDVDMDRIRGRFFRAAAILRGRYYRNEGQQNRGIVHWPSYANDYDDAHTREAVR